MMIMMGRWLMRIDVAIQVGLMVVAALAALVPAVPDLWRKARRYFSREARERRALGLHMALLPPHSGLTAYEQMALEIEALPDGAGKWALKASLDKVAKPSAACILRARSRRGKPQVPYGVIRALMRGERPYSMKVISDKEVA